MKKEALLKNTILQNTGSLKCAAKNAFKNLNLSFFTTPQFCENAIAFFSFKRSVQFTVGTKGEFIKVLFHISSSGHGVPKSNSVFEYKD